jgi:hypothetical protein
MEWLLIIGAFIFGFQVHLNQSTKVCIASGAAWALVTAYFAFEVIWK